MGTDAHRAARLKVAAASLLAALAVTVPATDALGRVAERRHADGVCKPATSEQRRCVVAVNGPTLPLRLNVPKTCHTEHFLAHAIAGFPKTVRYIALRIDGATLATTTAERPHWIGLGIDCTGLTVGDHLVTATLRRRDGTTVKVTRTVTRLAGAMPDDALARAVPAGRALCSNAPAAGAPGGPPPC